MKNPDFKSVLKIALVAFFALVIVGYSLFEARGIISGPILEIYEPIDGSGFEESLVKIHGRARNISFLSLNDSPIFIDEKGVFLEKFILAPGYNAIKISAKDRLGRERIKVLKLVYNLEK